MKTYKSYSTPEVELSLETDEVTYKVTLRRPEAEKTIETKSLEQALTLYDDLLEALTIDVFKSWRHG